MPPAARVRALLLDADGTLWDTRVAMERAGAAAARAAWPDLDEAAARVAGIRYRTDPVGAFRRFVTGELTFAAMREARLRDVAEAAGVAWADGAAAAFEAAYQPVFDESLVAYADTVPLLRWCAGVGLPVRVLTNSAQEYTLAKVVATGLGDLVVDVCSRDCVDVGKPDAAVFHHACAELGVAPAEVLYVGDEWTSDALGAADAGLHSAWLVRADGDPAGEVVPTEERLSAASARGIPVIGSLAEVPDVIESLVDLGAGGGGG